MSGGIGVKTGKRWIWRGLERSDDTAVVFRPQQREGLGLDGMGAAGPKPDERGQPEAARSGLFFHEQISTRRRLQCAEAQQNRRGAFFGRQARSGIFSGLRQIFLFIY